MTITKYTAKDAANCLEIYNYYIENTTITFEEEKLTLKALSDRFEKIFAKYPFLTAKCDGKTVGYAYLDVFNQRSAYRYTADLSIYLHKDVRGGGIGGKLLDAIEHAAREAGIKNLISIVTGENAASMHFHEKHGFKKVGTLEEVGVKFGKTLDVVYFEKKL